MPKKTYERLGSSGQPTFNLSEKNGACQNPTTTMTPQNPHSHQSDSYLPAGVGTKTLHILFRELTHFDESSLSKWLATGCRSFYVELCSMEDYKKAATAIRSVSAEFVVALPRILLPQTSGGSESKFLHKIADMQPDAVLARNLEELAFFRDRHVPVIVDFSLNVINDLAFYQMLDWGAERVTFGLDLDETQMMTLLQHVPTERVEQIILGRFPLFTMEHCLWRTQFLKAEEPCHKICRSQPLQIQDRYGALHTVRPDILCRNIVERSEPLETSPHVLSPHVSHYRIEWDDRMQGPPNL